MAGTYTLKVSGGDLVLDSKGRLETVSGKEKIIQDIGMILKSVKGSYPFKTSFGTDLVGIHEAGRDTTLIKKMIRAALLEYCEIDTVDSIAISFDADRHLTIQVTCTLVSGAIINTTETI